MTLIKKVLISIFLLIILVGCQKYVPKQMVFNVSGIDFTMIEVKGGTFSMGATHRDEDAFKDEFPSHEVTLTDYYIGQTEVTVELWNAVMGLPTESFSDHPIRNVSWNEIVNVFLPKLNEITGLTFTLPTEAQWEYAASGGKNTLRYKYSGSNNVEAVAWYAENTDFKGYSVAQKKPNSLGLYDMSGNVAEWCGDWYGEYSSSAQMNPNGPTSGDFRVLKGGCYESHDSWCRISNRSFDYPNSKSDINGFRLALRVL